MNHTAQYHSKSKLFRCGFWSDFCGTPEWFKGNTPHVSSKLACMFEFQSQHKKDNV